MLPALFSSWCEMEREGQAEEEKEGGCGQQAAGDLAVECKVFQRGHQPFALNASYQAGRQMAQSGVFPANVLPIPTILGNSVHVDAGGQGSVGPGIVEVLRLLYTPFSTQRTSYQPYSRTATRHTHH